MIYTIGHKASYFEYLSRPEPCLKAVGGSVWKTKEDAQKHCNENYEVFGVVAEWRVDTKPNKNGQWDDLLVNSEIVKLNDK